jgi:hypothetical protein
MTQHAGAPLDQESARTALDELFTLAPKYNASDAYLELMRFVGRFRFYSPFKCNVDLHADAGRTVRLHGSKVAAGLSSGDQNRRPADCNPATDGTVLFVFDASDAEPLPNASPLPVRVKDPFRAQR